MTYTKKARGVLLLLVVLFTSFFAATVQAYEITETNVPLGNNFLIEPAKFDIALDPGESGQVLLDVINRSPEEKKFTITIEDASGSQDTSKPVVLYGDEVGPYSIKEFLTPEINEFILGPGQRMRLPIGVAIPADTQPGGKYGTVLVSNASADGAGASGATTVSRIASLFLVRVNGDVIEGGQLEDFRVAGSNFILDTRGVVFEFLYSNNGNVHTNPYGTITVKNILGTVVSDIEVKPYYAMPNALRARDIAWERPAMLGIYTASIELNRGYDELIDTKTIYITIIPWRHIVVTVLLLMVLTFLIRKILSKFEIKRK